MRSAAVRKIYYSTLSCILAINCLVAQDLRMQLSKFHDVTIKKDPSNPGVLKVNRTGSSQFGHLSDRQRAYIGSYGKAFAKSLSEFRQERQRQSHKIATAIGETNSGRVVPVTSVRDVDLGQQLHSETVSTVKSSQTIAFPVTNLRDAALSPQSNGDTVPFIMQGKIEPAQMVNIPITNLRDVTLHKQINNGRGFASEGKPNQPVNEKLVPVTNFRDVKLKDIGGNQTKAAAIKESSVDTGSVPFSDFQGLSSYRGRRRGQMSRRLRSDVAFQNNQWSRVTRPNLGSLDSWSGSITSNTAASWPVQPPVRTHSARLNGWRHQPRHSHRQFKLPRKHFPQRQINNAFVQSRFRRQHKHHFI